MSDDVLKLEVFTSSTKKEYSVLLIESKAVARLEAKRKLKVNGFCVEDAGSEREAILKVHSKYTGYDLVLLKDELPDAKIIDVIQAVQKRMPMTPIVVLTQNRDKKWREDYLCYGCEEVIEAPLDSEGVLRLFQVIVRKNISAKERAALKIYNKGVRRKVAADELQVSEHTYAWHLKNIRKKFGVTERHEMMVLQTLMEKD